MYKCYCCDDKFSEVEDLVQHIETEHSEEIPKNFTPWQYYYSLKTGKTEGSCVVCKMATKWNESTHKYNRFCEMKQCKDTYRELFKERMITKHGKIHLLADPEQQKKMLANRSISGTYKWSDGTEKTYTGKNELDLLQFLDVFMNFQSEDVMCPSPHVYYYEYQGEEKFYIPDVFIASIGVELEAKDGGDNPNMHHKIQAVDKVKEKLKDEVMITQTSFSYVKVTNKEYGPFFTFLNLKKKLYADQEGEYKDRAVYVIPDENIEKESDFPVTENFEDSKREFAHLYLNMRNEICNRFKFMHPNEKDLKTDQDIIEQGEDRIHMVYSDHIHEDELFDQISEVVNFIMSTFGFERKKVAHKVAGIFTKYEEAEDIYVYKKDPSIEFHLNIDKRDFDIILKHNKTESVNESTTTNDDDLYPVFILLTFTNTNMAKAIRFVTGDPYSHSSISFDSSMRDVYSFGRKYKDSDMTFINEDIMDGLYKDLQDTAVYSLYVVFVNKDQYDLMKKKLEDFKKNQDKLRYSFVGLFNISIGRETHRENEYFCSQFIAEILKAGDPGLIKKDPSLYKPYDFKKLDNVFFVMRGKLSQYNQKKVDQKLKEIEDEYRNKITQAVGESFSIYLEGSGFSDYLDKLIYDSGDPSLSQVKEMLDTLEELSSCVGSYEQADKVISVIDGKIPMLQQDSGDNRVMAIIERLEYIKHRMTLLQDLSKYLAWK